MTEEIQYTDDFFINLTMDADGFLYTTSYPDADDAQAKNMIKAINTSGKVASIVGIIVSYFTPFAP